VTLKESGSERPSSGKAHTRKANKEVYTHVRERKTANEL